MFLCITCDNLIDNNVRSKFHSSYCFENFSFASHARTIIYLTSVSTTTPTSLLTTPLAANTTSGISSISSLLMIYISTTSTVSKSITAPVPTMALLLTLPSRTPATCGASFSSTAGSTAITFAATSIRRLLVRRSEPFGTLNTVLSSATVPTPQISTSRLQA